MNRDIEELRRVVSIFKAFTNKCEALVAKLRSDIKRKYVINEAEAFSMIRPIVKQFHIDIESYRMANKQLFEFIQKCLLRGTASGVLTHVYWWSVKDENNQNHLRVRYRSTPLEYILEPSNIACYKQAIIYLSLENWEDEYMAILSSFNIAITHDTTTPISNNVIYVLKLEDGKYYVGRTTNLHRRMIEHRNGNGSAWTKKYPMVELMQAMEHESPFYEDMIVKTMMFRYGIENVRGGSYAQTKLSEDMYHSLKREIYGATDKCFQCGGDHFVKDCPTRSDDGIEWMFENITDVSNRVYASAIRKTKRFINYLWS